MSEEIREAVQIIEVAYDGIEIAMKVGSGGVSAMQKALDFLTGMLDYEKSVRKRYEKSQAQDMPKTVKQSKPKKR